MGGDSFVLSLSFGEAGSVKCCDFFERRSEERGREKKVVRIDDETGEKKSGVIKYEGRLLTKEPFAENEMAQLTQ